MPRMRHVAGLAFLLVASVALAADPVQVRIPQPPVEVPPAPAPGSPLDLPSDFVYAVDADTDFLIFASPEGIVTITKEAGPLRYRGKFVGGTGKQETKHFTGKALAFVEANPGTSGVVELIIVPSTAKTEAGAIRQKLRVSSNTAPQPPPKPDPTPPSMSPIDADGLHVLIVFDPLKVLSPSQQSILDGKQARDYLEASCAAGPRNKQYRIWPSSTDGYADSQLWGDAAKRKRDSLPWLVVGNRKKGGYEGPLPTNTEEFIKLLDKYK